MLSLVFIKQQMPHGLSGCGEAGQEEGLVLVLGSMSARQSSGAGEEKKNMI